MPESAGLGSNTMITQNLPTNPIPRWGEVMSEKLIHRTDRIFVAGHAGMAGQAICRALERASYSHLLKVNRCDLDLLKSDSVDHWFAVHRPDIVIVAAAKVGGIYANTTYPADFLLENLKIEQHLIESAWKHGTRRLLFLGSSCIYPKYTKQPIQEESLLSGPLETTNEWYAIAKIAGLKLCQALRYQHGFDAISLMPTNLYGPGDNYHPKNSHVLPALIRRFYEATCQGEQSVTCWGTGSPRREFLHADDLGDACVHALEYWDPSSNNAPRDDQGHALTHLNVGTGSDISIHDLASLIANACDFRGNIVWDPSKPDGTPQKLLDIRRMTNFGWQPKIRLHDGITKTLEAFKYELEKDTLRA